MAPSDYLRWDKMKNDPRFIKVHTDAPRTFMESDALCKSEGARLIKFADNMEFHMMVALLHGSFKHFLNLLTGI